MSKKNSFAFWNYLAWLGLAIFFYTQERFSASASFAGVAVLTSIVQIKRTPKGHSTGWPVGAVAAATWIIIALEGVYR